MNILQFKRGTADDDSKRTTLNAGEIYVNTANNSVWVGKESGQFQIKSKPKIGVDIVNSSDAIVNEFITKLDIINDGANKPTVFRIYKNGSNSYEEKTISIQTSTSNATNAQYAQKIGTSSSLTTAGSTSRPVWVNSGTVTQINNLGNTSWRPDIIAHDICTYNKFQLLSVQQAGALLTVDSASTVKAHNGKGDASTPIYIKSDGTVDVCNNISVDALKYTDYTIKTLTVGDYVSARTLNITKTTLSNKKVSDWNQSLTNGALYEIVVSYTTTNMSNNYTRKCTHVIQYETNSYCLGTTSGDGVSVYRLMYNGTNNTHGGPKGWSWYIGTVNTSDSAYIVSYRRIG